GTPFDPFGLTEERRMERELISTYRTDIERAIEQLTPESLAVAVKLAELPAEIYGYGHIKAARVAETQQARADLLAALTTAYSIAAE
ncbi:MAG: hypothetical protein DI570_16495, partial [Phenylobacterium zucineum]